MLSQRQCRLADAAWRQCCRSDNADSKSMPAKPMRSGDHAGSVSMPLRLRRGRCGPETMLSTRQCWHCANAVALHAWTMRSGDCAGFAPMPLRPWRGRCGPETMLTTVNADISRCCELATDDLTHVCLLLFIVVPRLHIT